MTAILVNIDYLTDCPSFLPTVQCYGHLISGKKVVMVEVRCGLYSFGSYDRGRIKSISTPTKLKLNLVCKLRVKFDRNLSVTLIENKKP